MMEYRELKTMPEMEEIQQMEFNVWKVEPIPTHQTITAVKNGGIMVGLYDGDRMVGFSYGFAGFRNGKVYLCSHMLGVDPAYRSQGFGEKLKQAQRDIAIEKGYQVMHWTFDPLETRNAYLNLSKLNGICDTYIENCYGKMDDSLNKGLPTDRFELHWHLTSPHVANKHEPYVEHAIPINRLTFNTEGLPVFVDNMEQDLCAGAYKMCVPNDFQRLKTTNHSLALDWRLKTREQFQRLFQAGYTAVRLSRHENNGTYFFVKKNQLDIGGDEQ